MTYIELWIVVAVLCFLGEILTTSFFLLWFGISASISAIISYFNFDPIFQLIAFILLSLILLGASRPFTQKISHKTLRKAASDRLIGKQAIVIQEISPNNEGMVRVDGDIWKAKSSENIKKGQIVIIEYIDSIKVVVKLKEAS